MAAFPEGYARKVLQSVESTLDEAQRILPNLSGPTWILAHEQTAARGRRGRAWAMPPGNFAATLVLPEARPEQAALRSFVAALALFEACVSVTGRGQDFSLKWPNDVLLREGKLAGILLESIAPGFLAIGIGVNLAMAPDVADLEPDAVRPVSLHQTLGIACAPDAFLDHLAAAYARFEDQFRTFGFAPIRTAWLARAARLGEVIEARTMRESHVGTFADIDARGQLVLETSKGRVTIPAADVYF